MYRQIIPLKKSLLQFLPAHSLERTVCLFQQQGVREKIGNKGEEDLHLTKYFTIKTKRNVFIKQLLCNC